MHKYAKYHFTPMNNEEWETIWKSGGRLQDFEGMMHLKYDGLPGPILEYYLECQNEPVSAHTYWTRMWEIYKDDPVHGPIVMSKLMELDASP